MVYAKIAIFLTISMVLMIIPLAVQMKWRSIPLWKSVPVAFISTVGGTAAAMLWYLLENRAVGGFSFYGAIFLAPLLFLIAAKLLRLPFADVADICAAAECVVLVIMKGHCRVSGCCGGRLLYEFYSGYRLYFPSQIAELAVGLILLVIMLRRSRKNAVWGGVYPVFMILYGATRFVLNFFRWDQTPFVFGLTAGTFWSLCAMGIGGLWLILHRVTTTHRCHPEERGDEGSLH